MGRASLLLVLRLNHDDCRVVGEDAGHRRHLADVLCVARDPIVTAIERDRIAYVAFAALLNKSAGRKAAQEKGEVTQTDEDAHEVACGVGEDAC